MRLRIPTIYPITDVRFAGTSHPQQVEPLIAGGASIIQLREKRASPREFYREALVSVAIARASGVRIIINDRVDIALAVKADGVHLGQNDLPPGSARRILGDSAIIGFSTHSVEQAAAAAELPIDYIAVGPIFATTSKQDPDAVIGLDGLRAVRSVVRDKPLVAIGGINENNISDVLEAGADSAAIISAIVRDLSKIEVRMRHILETAYEATRSS